MPLEGETKHLPQCNAVPEAIKNKNPPASSSPDTAAPSLPAGDGPAAQLKHPRSVRALGKRTKIQKLYELMHWPVQDQRQGWILAVEEVLVARPGVLWPGLVQSHCYCLGSAEFLPWAQEPVEQWAGSEGQQCCHLTPLLCTQAGQFSQHPELTRSCCFPKSH